MRIVFLLSMTLVSSCSSLNIKSSTPAKIEMDGRFLCQTPCDVNTTFWAWPRRNFEAFPIDKEAGVRQSKEVIMDEIGNTDVYFDMGSVSGVQAYQAKERPESISIKIDANPEAKKEKDLKFFKKMHEEGNIDDQMYKDLVNKSLEESK